MTEAIALFFAGLGAIVGSFLNVVIHRLPRAEPMRLMGRSMCPSCGQVIAWHDNLPLLSYLLLRGRCRRCRWPIPVRYPAVEALGAVLFALAFLRGEALAWTPLLPAVALSAAFLASLVAAAIIDLRHRILPDLLTLKVALPIALVASATIPALHGTSLFGVSLASAGKPGLASLLVGGAGAVVGGGTILLARAVGGRLLRREAIGLGDAKLMAACGVMVGPEGALLSIAIASLLGSVVGVGFRLATRRREVPFGPFLATGVAISLLTGLHLRGL